MANFGKFANLSLHGWNGGSMTQTVAVGQNAHIGLWGGDSAGNDLAVTPADPSVCVLHEEPKPDQKKWPHWRHFLVTALRGGETQVNAFIRGTSTSWARMTIRTTGQSGVRLVFFPGERTLGSVTVGTIYVIGGGGESIKAAGGPPSGRPDRGGHTVEPTPPGNYVLGPRIRVTTSSWPKSTIAFGAALRRNASNEVEFEASPGKWRQATGPAGVVTAAGLAFGRREGKLLPLDRVVKLVRTYFVDPATGALWSNTWEKNDFGRWGWNLRRNGPTAFYVHTTPENEGETAQKRAVLLANSHGCVHLIPAERDRLMKAGYLNEGVPFEVRPYTENGPP